MIQAIFYIIAIILLAIAAFGVPSRVSLALLAAAFALLAYAWPLLAGLG